MVYRALAWLAVPSRLGSVCDDQEGFKNFPSSSALLHNVGRREHSERFWNSFKSLSEHNWQCDSICTHMLKKSRGIWVNIIYCHFISSFMITFVGQVLITKTCLKHNFSYACIPNYVISCVDQTHTCTHTHWFYNFWTTFFLRNEMRCFYGLCSFFSHCDAV